MASAVGGGKEREVINWECLASSFSQQEKTEQKKGSDGSEQASNSSSNNGVAQNAQPPRDLWHGRAVAMLQQSAEAGVMFQRAGRHQEAIAKFGEALKNPAANTQTKSHLYMHMGKSFFGSGQYSNAVDCFSNAIAGIDSFSESYLPYKLELTYRLAGALVRTENEGNIQHAIYFFSLISKLCSQVPFEGSNSFLVRAYLELTRALLIRNAQGDAEAVIKYAEAAIKLGPEEKEDLAWLFCHLAQAHARLDNHQQALAFYVKALEVPDAEDENLKKQVLARLERYKKS